MNDVMEWSERVELTHAAQVEQCKLDALEMIGENP